MTPGQVHYLTELCRQRDVPFNATLTKDEARHVIAGMQRERRMTREDVRAAAACPKCGAGKGQPCQGSRGDRKANHQERVNSASGKPL